jgi:hypothetical protein
MANISLAYLHLNLRWNPFGEIGKEDISQLAVVQVEQFIDRLQHAGFVLQYLGNPGRGKTTHLLTLHDYFPQAPYIHFKDNEKFPEIPLVPLLFLDETQRLPSSLRQRIFSREASFVIGTHVDHTSEYIKKGLEYKSIRLVGITVDRLEMIIQRRIEWARRDLGPVPTISRSETARLVNLYGDDLCAMFSRLYERFQSLKDIADVKI